MKRISILVVLLLSEIIGASWAYAQSATLSLDSPLSPFQAVRPYGLPNNTVPTAGRTLYSLPTIPCVATAVAPALIEGAFVNCSTDLSGNIRIVLGGSGLQNVNVTQLLGAAPSVTNTFPMRLSTGVSFYDARDRTWTLSSATDSVTVGNAFVLDATITGRWPAGSTPADGESNSVTVSRIGGFKFGFNGTTWDRIRTASGTNNTATTSTGVTPVSILSTWSCTHTPVAATRATCSKAAGGTTVRHVATHLTVCILDNKTNSNGFSAQMELRDGATGAGTVLWTAYLGIPMVINTPAVAKEHGQCVTTLLPSLTGSQNTAMTLESTAAGPANTLQTVTLMGYSTP